ncbi:17610_t:CDS:1, partial [Cetraspora pellucida]
TIIIFKSTYMQSITIFVNNNNYLNTASTPQDDEIIKGFNLFLADN